MVATGARYASKTWKMLSPQRQVPPLPPLWRMYRLDLHLHSALESLCPSFLIKGMNYSANKFPRNESGRSGGEGFSSGTDSKKEGDRSTSMFCGLDGKMAPSCVHRFIPFRKY